jgi:hypothetical protein
MLKLTNDFLRSLCTTGDVVFQVIGYTTVSLSVPMDENPCKEPVRELEVVSRIRQLISDFEHMLKIGSRVWKVLSI